MYRALALVLVFVSGSTALVYQVVWQKVLSQALGSDALASTLVLSVFFLHLSLGYFVIGRWSHLLLRDKLLLYGALEGAIGAWCLLSPGIFDALGPLFSSPAAGPGAELAAGLLVATLFLGFPTFLMGGTLPVLVEALSFEFEESHRIHAVLYGLNTAGAFAGALLAGFVLVEWLGLPGTIRATSAVNFALFAATALLSRLAPPRAGAAPAPDPDAAGGPDRGTRLALLAQSFLSGFYVFSLENALIRMAGISLGSSSYTYTIIVASFILAIAVGSLIVGRMRITGFRFFLGVQSALWLSVLALYFLIPEWPGLLLRVRSLFHPSLLNHGVYWGAVLAAFLAMLLVPVGLMGMNLPLLFNHLRSRSQHLSQVVGQIYAVNAVGSALGAVVGGYWLFYHLDGDRVFQLNLALVGLSIPLLFWLYASETRGVLRALAAAPLLGLVVLAWLPGWSQQRFVPGYFDLPLPPAADADFGAWLAGMEDYLDERFEVLFTRYDPNTIVHVVEDPKGRALYVNGKVDSHTASDSTTRSLTALVPLSLAPRIERVFVVGLGGGLSTAIASGFGEVERVRVAEISQGVIDALPWFEEVNARIEANRDKVELVRGDAYRLLLTDPARYDLILSEPSSTWVAGVEKLFSADFYREAARRLRPGGVYAQWLTVGFLDDATLVAVLRSFRSVFPWVTVWQSGSNSMVLLGSEAPLVLDVERMRARHREQPAAYEAVGLSHPLALLGLQALPPATLDRLTAGEGPVQSLDHPILAYRAGRAHFARLEADLARLVGAALEEPLARGDPAARFLLDEWPGDPPEGFFESLDRFGARHRPLRFLAARLAILRGLALPPEDRPPDARAAAYLLGRAEAPPPDMQRLLRTWSALQAGQLSPDPRRAAVAVAGACARDGCGAPGLALLQRLHGDEALRARGLDAGLRWEEATPPQRAAVEDWLAELFPGIFPAAGPEPVAQR